MNKKSLLIFLIIISLAVFLRLFNLGDNPPGLTNDEANVGYDAYSILKTQKDQWGSFLPLNSFLGFGDYRPPLYTYLVVLSIYFFGLNEYAVRYPSAIAGIITILITFILVKKIWGVKPALISSFLLTISPWHLGMSRVGIESNVGLLLTVLSLWFFYESLKKPKFIFAFVFFGVMCFYTYYSLRIFLPLFFLAMFFLYKKEMRLSKKYLLLSLFFGIVLLSPIIITNAKGSQSRMNQVLLSNNVGLINDINERRGACYSKIPSLLCNVVYNKPIAYTSSFISNYLNHYSADLLFLKGSSTSLSIMPSRGFFYMIEIILLITGLFILFTKKTKENLMLIVWILFAPIADSLTSSGHYSRMLVFLPAIQIVSSLGFMNIYEVVKKINKFYAGITVFVILAIIMFSFSFYLVDYFIYYPKYFSRSSHYGHKELFQYLYSLNNKFSAIYVSNRFYDTKQYVFYLFFNAYDPFKYHDENTKDYVKENKEWIKIKRIDNIHFVGSITELPKKLTKSLIAGNPSEFPEGIIRQKIYYDLKNDPVFAIVTSDELNKYTDAK